MTYRFQLTILLLSALLFVGCDSQTAQEQDDEPPKISIISPTNGTEVTEPMDIKAEVSDNQEVEKVIFIVNGSDEATLESTPYEYSWDPSKQADTREELKGEYRLEVKAFDLAGNEGTDSVKVTVPPLEVPISMISSGDPGQNFQFVFQADGKVFVERAVTTDRDGYIHDRELSSEYSQFDRITLPNEDDEFPCSLGRWYTTLHGSLIGVFEVNFEKTYSTKVFECG